MTAEIAIINRSGIALAADSAVTIGGDRVWKNSNKLFHLAPNADVGIMVFGNGGHCGLPWEVVIKQYRKYLGRRTHSKLTDYSEDFLTFLDSLNTPHPIQNDLNTYNNFLGVLKYARSAIDEARTKTQKRAIFIAEMQALIKEIDDKPIIFEDYTIDEFTTEYSTQIQSFLNDGIDIHVTKTVLTAMINACYEISIRTCASGAETGVVFAGFGEQELLPVVQEITVDGTLDNKVRAWTNRIQDTNKDNSGGMVIPFAQSDIAHLLIEGLLPDYIKFMAHTLQGTLDRKSEELVRDYVPENDKVVELARQRRANEVMTDSFLGSFQETRMDAFVQPMMRVIGSLPKEEMAAVAEALVETTSLRRKMDSKLETVGGPVDVALISKSDGFVWIKRKHYFNIELNQDFVQRRYERYAGENANDT